MSRFSKALPGVSSTGIGNFTIAGPDRFELANMNRQ